MRNLGLGDLGFLGAVGGVERDPFFANVALLIHGDGNNGSTAITDSSLSPKTVTPNGNAQISTSQSRFGVSSIAFDGTGDFLTFPSISIATNQSFTAEAWVYKTAIDGSGYSMVFSGSGGNEQFAYDSASTALVLGGSVVISANSSVGSNVWTHLAWVRDGTSLSAYRNGARIGTGTSGVAFNFGRIGAFSGGGFEVNGFIDEVRITVGVARYSGASFVVPTAPFPDA